MGREVCINFRCIYESSDGCTEDHAEDCKECVENRCTNCISSRRADSSCN